MSLVKISDNGQVFNIKRLPNFDNYEQWLDKFTENELGDLISHIDHVLLNTEKFSIATHFGKPWNDVLLPVYKITGGNEIQAAMLIGRMVQQAVIDSDETWMCTKTDLNDRGLDTNFYWTKRG